MIVPVDPIRARLRRLYAPGATYFITTVTADRKPILTDPAIVLLRQTLRAVQTVHPWRMIGYVFLPDHLHLMLVPTQPETITDVMHAIKRNFTRNYQRTFNVARPFTLWQRGYWDHVIRNERDFEKHLDYIHYNPVRHGYARTPEAYPHSSYLAYVERGWYELGWGHAEPTNLINAHE